MKYFYVLLVVLALLIFGFFIKQDQKCAEQGGQYVRSLWGMVCVFEVKK